MFEVVLIALVAWGALAFGAVYPWAYVPLMAGVALLGVWALASKKRIATTPSSLKVGLLLVAIAISVQLVPLPRQTLVAISPAADTLVRQFDPFYAYRVATEARVSHPLSISPEKTRTGLLFFAALAVLLLGLARVMSLRRVRRFAAGLVVVGGAIALIGIIQRPLFGGRIYGLWTPDAGPLLFDPSGGPFGPFVNRNHFAGWMLMALPMAIGYWAGLVQQATRGVRSDWRDRLLWLSSAEANRVILVGFCILAMAVSLVLTLSRSGLACFGVAIVLTTSTIGRGIRATRRLAVGLSIAALAFVSVRLANLSMIESRFNEFSRDLDMRMGAWDDAIRIFQAFPLTGTGLDTYGIATLFHQTYRTDILHFAEAHNDYLQLLAEGGLLLTIPAAVAVIAFVVAVYGRLNSGRDDVPGYRLRLGAATGLVAIGLQEIIDFSLQMPGNAVLFTVLAAIAVTGHELRSEKHRIPLNRESTETT